RYARHMAGLFTVRGSYGFKTVKKIIQQAQPGKKHDSRQQCGFQFPVCCGQINSKYLAGGSCQCGSVHFFLFLDKSAQERTVANQVNQPRDPTAILVYAIQRVVWKKITSPAGNLKSVINVIDDL